MLYALTLLHGRAGLAIRSLPIKLPAITTMGIGVVALRAMLAVVRFRTTMTSTRSPIISVTRAARSEYVAGLGLEVSARCHCPWHRDPPNPFASGSSEDCGAEPGWQRACQGAANSSSRPSLA